MNCRECISRRKFLRVGGQSVSALALATPIASLLLSCGQNPLASPLGLPAATQIGNNPTNIYTFSFSDHPELASVGGSLHASIQASSGPKDVYITRVSTSSATTVSTICTHAGCTLNSYDSASEEYLCPCHNSIFGATGNVVQGPANTPLPSYSTTLTASGIEVTVA